ncbi:MAG: alpha-hydroxy-acid oxidizing protein [Treponema sp.]|nr:alpha-hydroxy-acid oxidizing protein [Treponema sp.]
MYVWEEKQNNFKCHYCPVCNGFGCVGQLPGLGGVYENKNFQLNCSAWKQIRDNNPELLDDITSIKVTRNKLRCGPVTGAQENIGFAEEKDFYFPYFEASKNSGIGVCVGDGCPDEKLQYGLEAAKACGFVARNGDSSGAAFFLKPYPLEVLKKRVELIKDTASFIGMDIDSYNILTMRKLVNLEKKTAQDLKAFRNLFEQPFVIKGVFTAEDVELVKQIKPDVVFISNHGGRIETRVGSSAEFLVNYGEELKKYCKEIWIDGGIRTKEDVQTALYFGAERVLLARPIISALTKGGKEEVEKLISLLVD